MKKTIFLSAAMAFVTFGAFAQQTTTPAAGTATPKREGQMPGGTVEERAKRQADHINSVAKLSTDQYAKVLEISKKFSAQKDALRSSGIQRDDPKFKALNEQEEAQLKTVLTADQYSKVMAARMERQNHRGE
jgi:hypothetical protein